MKKLRELALVLGFTGLLALPAMAADVSYTTVLSGKVVSVTAVGTPVKEGDVLLTVNSLAGPMPAARADRDGVIKEVLVQPGAAVEEGAVVVVVDANE